MAVYTLTASQLRGAGILNSFIIPSSSTPPTPTFDADAQAFITAATITDPTQQTAINTLVVSMKGYGIWMKMKALYPMVGGTAAQHKFNLKNPLDTDTAFRLVFNGGWTHSSTGAKPNGTNAYANSFFNPSLHNVANSSHMSYYSRTLYVDSATAASEMGCYTANGNQRNVIFASGNGTSYCVPNNNNEFIVSFTSDGVGFYVASRTSATAIMGQRNSTQYTNTATTFRINNIITLGASSGPSAGSYGAYSPRESAFASIGDGLTSTEAANYYTAVQTFQTTLGRHVGVPIVSDSDAQAFLNAAVITDSTQASAVNTLVTDLKGYGVWTKMKALYPFVGGTATTHKFNLKNPLDTDAAFRLVFNGGWTHSSTGALPNGTNSYANTFFRPNNWTNINNAHMSYYSRTNVNGSQVEIGLFANDGNGNSNNSLAVRYNDSFQSLLNLFSNNGWLLVANTNSLGQFMANRYVTNSLNSWKNGIKQGEISSTPSINTGNIYNYTLGSYNSNGTAEAFSTKQAAFASFGDGLTDTEAANYYTAVQTFQTTLGRQV